MCEALAAAPPSLRSLALFGEWTPQVADEVSQLEQLRVLALYEQEREPGSGDEAEVWQNFGGPKPWTRSRLCTRGGAGTVWANLRALMWHAAARLPEVGRTGWRGEGASVWLKGGTRLAA